MKYVIAIFFSSASLLYITQLIMRIVFSASTLWIEPLIQYLFLMCGLFGAAVAVENDENIKIEIFRNLSKNRYIIIIKYLFSMIVTGIITFIFMKSFKMNLEFDELSSFKVKTYLLDLPYILVFLLSAFYYAKNIYTKGIKRQ